eukprot:1195570-Prorocentrum_minimum.AAC.5
MMAATLAREAAARVNDAAQLQAVIASVKESDACEAAARVEDAVVSLQPVVSPPLSMCNMLTISAHRRPSQPYACARPSPAHTPICWSIAQFGSTPTPGIKSSPTVQYSVM